MAKRSHRPPSQRQLRVGEALRHALAEVLMRGDLRDPDLCGASLTVTEVRVGPDLRTATAFVVPLGGGDVAGVLAGLGRAAPYLRTQVARLVSLKFAPEFTFRADTSFDQARRIDGILRTAGVAGDGGPEYEGDGGAA